MMLFLRKIGLLLTVLAHVVLTFIFVGGEREPRFDLWNILTHEGMLRLFIIQKTVLGHSAVMDT